MARRAPSVVLAVVAALASPVGAQIRSEVIARGLRNPVAVIEEPTRPHTFFVVEQGGLVRIVRDGELLAEPFLDLRGEVSTGGERGLLGMALAPDYAATRRFFVNFTNRSGHTVIARLSTRADDPLRADPASRFDLQWPDGRRFLEQPFSNHNGGHLAFGPDGYLYVGLGDGGSGGDPMNHAQRTDSLLGKMLRLDVDVADDDRRGYRVPDDNPFLDEDPVRAHGEIWSFGLRNPWRYSFDDPSRGGTGALVIADVGQNAREEVNFEPAGRGGRNYGWRVREGREPYDSRTSPAFSPLTEPIHDYGRSTGSSITGGYVYRGSALDPSFAGRYFFADFIFGRVFSIGLHLEESGEARADDERERTDALGGRDTLGMVSSFAEDRDGELVLLNYGAGSIVRVVPDFAVVPRAPRVTAAADAGVIHLSWQFADGVEAWTHLVERVRDGRVIERITAERAELTLETAAGDCFRVRGTARNGFSGPAMSTCAG